jgi:hypothetical protein
LRIYISIVGYVGYLREALHLGLRKT